MTRRVKLIFTFSILLNVLLVGALGGLVLNRVSDRLGGTGAVAREHLAPESRQKIMGIVQRNRVGMRPAMQRVKESRDRVFEALAAETFDPEAYEAAIEELADLQSHVFLERAKVTKEIAASLPPGERRKMAEAIRRRDMLFSTRSGGRMEDAGRPSWRFQPEP